MAGRSAVTVLAGSGVQPVVDQLSRDPHSLARTWAAHLRVNGHPKLPMAFDALLVVSPEHGRVLREEADVRDPHLDGGVVAGQPRIEVQHPLVEENARAEQLPRVPAVLPG